MRGNRTLTILAILLIVIAGAVAALYFSGMLSFGQPEEEVTPVPTAEVNTQDIVVAGNNIDRGATLSSENNGIITWTWPTAELPPGYFERLDQVEGRVARVDIPRGMPILPTMLGEPGGKLSMEGSAASFFDDPTRRAYVIPMDTQGAVAWALRPGDRVDVLASIELQPVDEEFQTPLPNQFQTLSPVAAGGEEGQAVFQGGAYGRFETLPNGLEGLIIPSQTPLPSYMVVQMTVQDAIVWHVGIWESEEDRVGEQAAPTAQPEGEGTLGEVQAPPAGAPAAGTPDQRVEVEPITLLVTPQDALILKYLHEMGADLDLALRSAGNEETTFTEPVWLRYVLDKYQMPGDPPQLPIAITPVDETLELTPLTPPPTEQPEE